MLGKHDYQSLDRLTLKLWRMVNYQLCSNSYNVNRTKFFDHLAVFTQFETKGAYQLSKKGRHGLRLVMQTAATCGEALYFR